MVLTDDPIEFKNSDSVPRRLFQFLPHGIQVDQHVFCEITFPKIVMDSSFNSNDFDPNIRQKVRTII